MRSLLRIRRYERPAGSRGPAQGVKVELAVEEGQVDAVGGQPERATGVHGASYESGAAPRSAGEHAATAGRACVRTAQSSWHAPSVRSERVATPTRTNRLR